MKVNVPKNSQQRKRAIVCSSGRYLKLNPLPAVPSSPWLRPRRLAPPLLSRSETNLPTDSAIEPTAVVLQLAPHTHFGTVYDAETESKVWLDISLVPLKQVWEFSLARTVRGWNRQSRAFTACTSPGKWRTICRNVRGDTWSHSAHSSKVSMASSSTAFVLRRIISTRPRRPRRLR